MSPQVDNRDTKSAYSRVEEAKNFVLSHWKFLESEKPIGIVLGSGLGLLKERLRNRRTISYKDIPFMPGVKVPGHEGSLVLGSLGQTLLLCLSGRAHLYEGHSPADVVFGVRLLAALGSRATILSNAAGGIAPDCSPGTLMLVSDHLNLTGQSPLVGRNDERLGPRFPDMSSVYCPSLRSVTKEAARREGITLKEGVYAGMLGPSYETPAEIRMLAALGASAVGMSTVHEAIALTHQGVPVVGLSCITNYAAGLSPTPLNHEEVSRVAGQASESFCRLVEQLCLGLAPSEA